jgi:hypothetical protein
MSLGSCTVLIYDAAHYERRAEPVDPDDINFLYEPPFEWKGV